MTVPAPDTLSRRNARSAWADPEADADPNLERERWPRVRATPVVDFEVERVEYAREQKP